MRRWLHDHLGRRGSALLWFGALDLVYAYALLDSPDSISPTFGWFGSILPLDAWAAIWFVVGAVCLISAVRRVDQVGFVAAIGIKVIWGTVSLAGAILAGVPVSSVGIWLGLAGLVWIIAGWPEADPVGDDARHDDRAT